MKPLELELSMEQEFEKAKLLAAASQMSKEQLIDYLESIITLYFSKDNVIKSLMKQELSGDF